MEEKNKIVMFSQEVKELKSSELLKCLCCDGTGYVEGEYYDEVQSCLTCSGSGHFNYI